MAKGKTTKKSSERNTRTNRNTGGTGRDDDWL
jgi:hypothetical protein